MMGGAAGDGADDAIKNYEDLNVVVANVVDMQGGQTFDQW